MDGQDGQDERRVRDDEGAAISNPKFEIRDSGSFIIPSILSIRVEFPVQSSVNDAG
jgi:hypothetical protein